MHTNQWARNSDAIEDARETFDTATVSKAVRWVIANDLAEATDLYAALTEIFVSQGNSNASACNANRAIEIAMDAYLQEIKRREAA